jgi:pimeloyl-ACP methyl ester carboxylesterase
MEAFELFTVKANGITHRVASVKGCPPARSAMPLVMLLHGWPESWYSWRHQLLALASAGYPVVAPDMRGFGGTDAPDHVREYTVDRLCLDVLKIAESLGYSRIIVIGHDLGSYLAWHLALLHPKVIVAVCGMSVPYLGYSPRNEPLLSRLQRNFGTCLPESPYCASRNEQENAKFHYILHHNLPQVGEEYDRNCEEPCTDSTLSSRVSIVNLPR